MMAAASWKECVPLRKKSRVFGFPQGGGIARLFCNLEMAQVLPHSRGRAAVGRGYRCSLLAKDGELCCPDSPGGHFEMVGKFESYGSSEFSALLCSLRFPRKCNDETGTTCKT